MVKLLGVPFHFGQSEIGVEKTSKFLRELGIKNNLSAFHTLTDLGDLTYY